MRGFLLCRRGEVINTRHQSTRILYSSFGQTAIVSPCLLSTCSKDKIESGKENWFADFDIVDLSNQTTDS